MNLAASTRQCCSTTGRCFVVASAELEMYTPSTSTDLGTWAPAGTMTKERDALYTATLLSNGTVLIVGGKDETEGSARGVASVEIYDPATFVVEE